VKEVAMIPLLCTAEMKSSNSLSFVHVAMIFAAAITLPLANHLSKHTITPEGSAFLISIWIFAATLSRSKDAVLTAFIFSLFVGIFFFVFGPVMLEYVPPAILQPFVHFPYGTNLYPNLESKQFLEIKVYENLTMKSVYEVVSTINEPVLFRGSIRDSETIGRRIVNRLETSKKRYTSQRFQARPYDFFRGSLFEAGLSSNISEVLESKHNEYVSFEPLLTPEEGVELLEVNQHAQISILEDNSFLSNFSETIVTTFVHAAPLSMSWAYQMAGKKTWYFWSPPLGTALNSGWFCRVAVPSHGDEALLFSHEAIRVTVNAGDILVFPPQWYHTVVTHSGYNFMINLRTKYGNYFPSVLRTIRFLPTTLLIRFFGRPTPHHQPGLRKIRVNDLQSAFEASPELLRWEDPEKYT
jgi:hypothetical protein